MKNPLSLMKPIVITATIALICVAAFAFVIMGSPNTKAEANNEAGQDSNQDSNESEPISVNVNRPVEPQGNQAVNAPSDPTPEPLPVIRGLGDLLSEEELESYEARFNANLTFHKLTGTWGRWEYIGESTRERVRSTLVGLVRVDEAIDQRDNPLTLIAKTLDMKAQKMVNFVAKEGGDMNLQEVNILLSTTAVIADTVLKGYEKVKAYRDSGVLQGEELVEFSNRYRALQSMIVTFNQSFQAQRELLKHRRNGNDDDDDNPAMLPEDRPDR